MPDIVEIAEVRLLLDEQAAALRLSEVSHRTLFDANPHPMWVYDLDSLRFIAVNDAAIWRYGYSRDEFLAMTIIDIRPPDDVPRLLENIARVEDQLDEAGEWRHLTRDGRVLDVEIVSHPLQFAGHRAELVLAQDITERKRTEAQRNREQHETQRALERLNEAQRIGRIGDWEYDIASGRITWSPQVFELMGRDPMLGPPRDIGELVGHLSPASQKLQDASVARAIGTGLIQEYELVVPRADGETVMHTVAVPRQDADGTVVSLHGTVQDITAKKQDELALRRRARQHVLVAELGRRVLSEGHPDHIFAEAAIALASGLGVEYSCVLLTDPLDGGVTLRTGCGWQPGWTGQRVVSETGTHLAFVLHSGAPVIVDDFERDIRFPPSEMLRSHGIVSGINAIIGPVDHPIGTIGAYAQQTQKFSADDVGFVLSIANTLDTAIERGRTRDRLTYMAQHDALTDLPNRVLLTDRLEVEMSRAARSGKRLAMMFIDLDRFKNVNDVYGHEGGDLLLREVASRLQHTVRSVDTVSRQGGDEFLVVLPEIACDEDAGRVAQKLIDAVLAPFVLSGNEIIVGCSIGIVCYPENGRDVETLMRNADVAMYVAKDQGRGCYQFYSEAMNARSHERLLIENHLRYAIARDELWIAYQVQLTLGTRRPVGLEALVRWKHPIRGALVGPAEFIPIAEESGLILKIGAWVLEGACRQHAAWLREGLIEGTVAVNVSPLQFRQADFVEQVTDTLRRAGLDPRALEIEVTESAVMRDVEDVLCKLGRLETLGVRIAIDDFGTGYSSLGYLRRFPIHRLKIDQSFVRGLPDDREGTAIVGAIISLGQSLGLDVLAEGIETEQQAKSLRDMGCNNGQGFLFGRPMATDECAALLRQYSAPAPAPAATDPKLNLL